MSDNNILGKIICDKRRGGRVGHVGEDAIMLCRLSRGRLLYMGYRTSSLIMELLFVSMLHINNQ
jgi:hypothetical protein